MNIGEKIKALRIRKDMTQAEIAGEIVSRNMVSLIENGRATPSLQTLEAIAAKLNVSVSFLTADPSEQEAMLKNERISDIRLAFARKDYRICTDLCRSLIGKSEEKDDELELILAESLLENAVEAFLSDRIRTCCLLLDEAVLHAMNTVYYTEHILTAAWLYFEYFGLLTPSLVSENLETGFLPKEVAPNRVFCRYIRAILEESYDSFEASPSDPPCARLLENHVKALLQMREGNYEKAGAYLGDILRSNEILPGIVMYHVFGDMEECCRMLGNRKSEINYQDAKVSMFEKVLS